MSKAYKLLLRLIQVNEAHQYRRAANNLDEIVGYKTWDELLRNTDEYSGAGWNVFSDN